MTIAMANNSKTATAIVTPIIMIEDEVLVCEMGDVVVAAAMSVLDIISALETPIDNNYNNYFHKNRRTE